MKDNIDWGEIALIAAVVIIGVVGMITGTIHG